MKRIVLALTVLLLGFGQAKAIDATYNKLGNDRVLLCNDELKKLGPILVLMAVSNQTYYATNSAAPYYWVHTDVQAPPLMRIQVPNMKAGASHVYYNHDGTALWRLDNVRTGSSYPANTTFATSRNFLPWSPGSLQIDDVSQYVGSIGKQSAQLIMQNTTAAQVVSPYYEDGIGTVYFDAVNAWKAASGTIALDIATNAVDGAQLSPTTKIDNVSWKPASFTVLGVDASGNVTLRTASETSLLMDSTAGATNFFYRIRATLNYRGPSRFRIRRVDTASGALDSQTYLLLDNIRVSYPPQSAALDHYGTYDASRQGSAVVGEANTLSAAYPAVDQEGVLARAKVAFLTNGCVQWVPSLFVAGTTTTVSNVKFVYRWRYLDQLVTDWSSVALTNVTGNTDATTVSTDAVPLTNGVGDVEFYFTADVDGCYYTPSYDFSGTGAGYGDGWTEKITAITNRASFASKTAAGGTDYFLRLREGYSPYESVRLVTTTTTTGAVESVATEMELIGSDRWRAFIKTANTNMGAVAFHFQGLNRTDDGAEALSVNTQAWWGTVSVLATNDLPYSGATAAADTGSDVSLPVDAANGYLMFEFNDSTLSYAISHADYQNFNLWSDAAGSVFVGSYSETSGVSSVKQMMEETFTNAPSSVAFATNSHWTESFNQGGMVISDYPYYTPFSSHMTPNGWTAEQGMFVGKTFLTNGMALQLEGRGKGSVAFTDTAYPLTGFGSFDFNARLAQFLDFEDFAYYIGDDAMGLRNYGISAKVALSTDSGNDLSPGTPSLSMVGFYRPTQGCYEFRVTRVDTNQLDLAIYRWNSGGSSLTANLLTNILTSVKPSDGTARLFTNMLISASSTRLSIMSLSVATNGSGAAVIKGGLSMSDASSTLFTPNLFGNMFTIAYTDTSSSRLQRGTFGVGTTDCLGDISSIQRNTLDASLDIKLTSGTPERSNLDGGNWAVPIGRNAIFSETDYMGYGIRGIATPQTLKVYTSPTSGSLAWTDTGLTLVASNFMNATFRFAPETTKNYYVRLAHGGASTDSRTDVVVDNLKITAWRGQLAWDGAEKAGTSDRTDFDNSTSGQSNLWVWTEAWIDEVVTTNKAKQVSTAKVCSFQPKRADPGYPLSLRTPQMNGIGMFTFTYTNAAPGAKLTLQIATNGVKRTTMVPITLAIYDEKYWVDVTNITFTGSSPSSGSMTFFFGLRAPVNGVLRLLMDPSIVSNAQTLASAAAKQVTITSAVCYDEPALDNRSWWGWNIMTTTNSPYVYLPDPSLRPSPGMSGALNNSMTDGVKGSSSDYAPHSPFVQSPYAVNGIGQVNFRARKFDRASGTPSVVTIYGSKTDGSAPDSGWTELTNIVVSSPSYRLYSWAVEGDSSEYKAVRLGVKGVKAGDTPYLSPVERVLLEEVVVSEPVAPRIAFVLVRPFRSQIITDTIITNLASCDEQPLAGETFGLQAEMQLQQLANEIDLSSLKVHMAYYTGTSPWGYENWKDNAAAVKTTLEPTASNLVFRSSYNVPASIIPPQNNGDAGTVVQYHVWATYRKIGSETSAKLIQHDLNSSEWSNPDWYWPIDFNKTYGGAEGTFAAYTILDSVSPHRVWINEVNYYDGLAADNTALGDTNQFIEVAVPAGVDISDWYLMGTTRTMDSQVIATFGGYGGVASKKILNATNRYAFLTLTSPKTTAAQGAADGTWATSFPSPTFGDGRLHYWEPYALSVVRPSGIVECQIVVGATNLLAGYVLYSPTNLCGKLLAATPGSKWYFAGDDFDDGTLGVMTGHGSQKSDWEAQSLAQKSLAQTPQRVNRRRDGTPQDIDPNYYLPPNGTNIWIYATIATAHLLQVTSAGNTNTSEIIIVPSGGSTNITYVADPWFRIGSIMTNGGLVASAADQQTYRLELNDLKANMDIVASAAISPALTNLGVDAGNPYADSILNWIQTFPEGPIVLAGYYSPAGIYQRDLSLTEMYWLDINPVRTNRFYAGFYDTGTVKIPTPSPVLYTNNVNGAPYVVTNFRMKVFMMITNLQDNVAHAPYVLQGLGNASSTNYSEANPDSVWTSVTFKVQAALAHKPSTWIALRWFVFHPDSFGAPDSANPFCSLIEVWDPFDVNSPACVSGWGPFRGEGLFFTWAIDPSRRPDTVEVLTTNSVWESAIIP